MYQAFAVGLLSSEDILQFPSSFIDFTRSRCQDLRKWFFKNKNSVCCEHLSACKGVYRWNSVSVGHRGKIVAKAKPSKVCLSLLRMLTTIHISFIIDRGINDIHLQEMRYLSSNIHRWFLSTITVGAPGLEQSQSYRQSLSPDFLRKEILMSNLWFLHFSVISQRCRVYLSQNVYILCTNYKHDSVPQNHDLPDTNYLAR